MIHIIYILHLPLRDDLHHPISCIFRCEMIQIILYNFSMPTSERPRSKSSKSCSTCLVARWLTSRSHQAKHYIDCVPLNTDFLDEVTQNPYYARSKYPTQLAKMSFHEILDLTALTFYFILQQILQINIRPKKNLKRKWHHETGCPDLCPLCGNMYREELTSPSRATTTNQQQRHHHHHH